MLLHSGATTIAMVVVLWGGMTLSSGQTTTPAVTGVAQGDILSLKPTGEVDRLRAELNDARREQTFWKATAIGLPVIAALVGIVVTYYLQTRQYHASRADATSTALIERDKLVVTLMETLSPAEREAGIRAKLRQLDPEIADLTLAAAGGESHFTAALYQLINDAHVHVRERLIGAIEGDAWNESRSQYPLMKNGVRVGTAMAMAGWTPVGVIEAGDGLTLVDGADNPYDAKVVATDAQTGLVIYQQINPTSRFDQYATELPQVGTLVYMPSKAMPSGFFVTRIAAIKEPFIILEGWPEDCRPGDPVYGPKGLVGLAREANRAVSAVVATSFASTHYEASRRREP